jgi:hypothetical protein
MLKPCSQVASSLHIVDRKEYTFFFSPSDT